MLNYTEFEMMVKDHNGQMAERKENLEKVHKSDPVGWFESSPSLLNETRRCSS